MNDTRVRTRRFAQATPRAWRQCYGKLRHPSKKNASAFARKLGDTLRAYHCPWCRSWHIGHSRQRAS